MEHINKLIEATSPYLLQHAHNPVNWYPWSNEAIELAKKENKLILVSIGYAACHWCHVMEHESFEDTAVAQLMNNNFVCVKVDREERPDIDYYYMSAVQLMGQRGGWPLNVIALPDGRPIWGGTYFPKELWIKNLQAVSNFYSRNPVETQKYAEELQQGIKQLSLAPKVESTMPISSKLLAKGVKQWHAYWDMKNGGSLGSPKFPMPVNLSFLLYYADRTDSKNTFDYVEISLKKMARGGIYDQIGGGFARYSVDEKWKVPHFEKMLYDNGQLLSIYSNAYQQFKNEEFKTTVFQTVDFLERELMDKSGAFYSSLDADSEGEEGKFYVWKKDELERIIGKDYALFEDYYNVNEEGLWEHGNYILLRKEGDVSFAKKNEIGLAELQLKVKGWKEALLLEREKRVRPGLDDKTLTAWNALVIKGLVDAYKAFKNKRFLKLAIKNARFIADNQLSESGKLLRNWKAGTSSIDGFLEDYALVIAAYISLFEATGNEEWLKLAQKINEYALQNFYNENTGLFYFSETKKEAVVLNHFQKEDNVIPAANSVMANNLHYLYLLLGKPKYLEIVEGMLQTIAPNLDAHLASYANWGNVSLKLTEPFFEIVICGTEANNLFDEFQSQYHPNVLWGLVKGESQIPLLENRFVAGENIIYVCHKGACQLPVKSVAEALKLMNCK